MGKSQYHGVRLPKVRHDQKVTVSIGFALVASEPSDGNNSDDTESDQHSGEDESEPPTGATGKGRKRKAAATDKSAVARRPKRSRHQTTPFVPHQRAGRDVAKYEDGEETGDKLWNIHPTYASFRKIGKVGVWTATVGGFVTVSMANAKIAVSQPLRGFIVYLMKNKLQTRSTRAVVVHVLGRDDAWDTLVPDGYIVVTLLIFVM